MNIYISLSTLILSGLFLLLLPNLSIPYEKVKNEQKNSTSSPIIIFQPPPDKGKPQKSVGGGTRDERKCPQDQWQNISGTEIIPKDNPSILALVPLQHRSLTLASHPTVWINLAPTSAKQIIFNIRESCDR